MSDHIIALIGLILTVIILGVGIWTLCLTKKGVDHAKIAASAAQVSLDELLLEKQAKELSAIEEGLLGLLQGAPGEALLRIPGHFHQDLDLVMVRIGTEQPFKIPALALNRLEHLKHIETTGHQSWWPKENQSLFGFGYRLTPQGRIQAREVPGGVQEAALAPCRVTVEQVLSHQA